MTTTEINKTENSKKLNDLFDRGVNSLTPEIEEIFKQGIDPLFDDNGFNLLHTHLQHGGNLEVVKYLVEQGVDVKAVTPNGHSVIDMAKVISAAERLSGKKENPDVITFLEKVSATTNKSD